MGRCLHDRPILLNRDAVAYGSDKETGVWLRNVGKKHRRKINVNQFKRHSHFIGYIKLNMVVMFDVIKIFD